MTKPRAPLTARQTVERAASEEDLLIAVTEALTLCGWLWTHTRRTDKAVTMGHPGVPDIIAVKAGRVLFLELKTEKKGVVTTEQWAWIAAARGFAQLRGDTAEYGDAYVIRPSDLDWLLKEIAK